MIRFLDVERQKTWMRQIELKIDNVGKTEESQYGFCQVVQATDGVRRTEPLNYFFEHLEGSIDPSETGVQWYDVKWDEKNGYFRCKPAEAKPKELKSEGPDWDKIPLGKCRFGILCAYIQSSGLPVYLEQGKTEFSLKNGVLNQINKLAQFSMTGEIEDETPAK